MVRNYDNSMIPLLVFESRQTIDSLKSYCWTKLERNWNAEINQSGHKFLLARDPTNLFLLVDSSLVAICDETTTSGSYVEGLWTKDLAEVFIREDGSNSYQEFNLSPRGAWWSMLFGKPRDRLTDQFKMPNCQVVSEVRADGWFAGIQIEIASLSIRCKFQKGSALNVTAVYGENPRTYLSFVKLPGEKPNFHQPSVFAPVMLVEQK